MLTAKEKSIRKSIKNLYQKAIAEAKLVNKKFEPKYKDLDKWFNSVELTTKTRRLYYKKFDKIHEEELKEIYVIRDKYNKPLKKLWQQLAKIAIANGEEVISMDWRTF